MAGFEIWFGGLGIGVGLSELGVYAVPKHPDFGFEWCAFSNVTVGLCAPASAASR